MKQYKSSLGLVSGVLVSCAMSSAALAAPSPLTLESRLPAWGDYGSKTVDFTDIAINYQSGRVKRGKWQDTQFWGDNLGTKPDGTPASTFSLNNLSAGVDNVAFDGRVIIDAQISSKGVLKARTSTFGIWSSDAMFGNNTVDYACSVVSGGKVKETICSNGVLVYGGDLLDFGWSGTEGVLEFEIHNLKGWAFDQWEDVPADMHANEHIFLDVGVFDLGGVANVRTFSEIAENGFAVVPVPAAVWLFGSGLLGLLGMARRKRA